MLKNNITLIGRLTSDPELRKTSNDKSVLNISIAVDRPKNKEVVDFFPCIFWGMTAEYIAKYAKKGSFVGVSGMLTQRKYTAKDGTNRSILEVQVEDASILEYGAKKTGGEEATTTSGTATGYNVEEDIVPEDEADEELPF